MSTPINDGGPAFPHATEGEYSDPQTCTHWRPYLGMTLRDYFAGQAMMAQDMTGLMSEAFEAGEQHLFSSTFAQACYKMADAMLEARNQKGAA